MKRDRGMESEVDQNQQDISLPLELYLSHCSYWKTFIVERRDAIDEE